MRLATACEGLTLKEILLTANDQGRQLALAECLCQIQAHHGFIKANQVCLIKALFGKGGSRHDFEKEALLAAGKEDFP